MNDKCLIILKGYELMQEIANGKIKEGTKFRDLTDNNYEDDSNIYRYENKNFIGRWGGTNILKLLNHDFKIIENEEEIDIQAINENDYIIEYRSKDIFTSETLNDLIYKIVFEIMRNRNKQNEILKAVKQLDKKINKEEM